MTKDKSKNFPEKEKAKTQPMNSIDQFEDRASSRRGQYEGEPSRELCDRLSRTRDASQRQLPTDQDYAVSTREYQTDQSSPKPAPAAARPVLEKRRKQRHSPRRCADVDRSLHIRSLITCSSAMTYPLAATLLSGHPAGRNGIVRGHFTENATFRAVRRITSELPVIQQQRMLMA